MPQHHCASPVAAFQNLLGLRWSLPPKSITLAEINAGLNGEADGLRTIFGLAEEAIYTGRAVVTASTAVAGVSPVTKAQPVFKLRSGDILTLQQAHGDFALIRNQAGHEAWVKADEIARIIPVSRTLPRS